MSFENLVKRLTYLPPMPLRMLRRYVVGHISEGRGALLSDTGAITEYDSIEALVRGFLSAEWRGYELLLHDADYELTDVLPVLVALAGEGYETEIALHREQRIMYLASTRGKQTWRIRDTYALMPVPVADMAALAGVEWSDDGGVAQYMRVLYEAYKSYTLLLYDVFAVVPGYSAGSTALRAFRRLMPEGAIYYRMRDEVEALAREAYVGGLLFAQGHGKGSSYTDMVKIDVNAMYASIMAQGVPVGPGAYTHEEVKGLPGVYLCDITPPADLPLPFVPHRVDYRVSYPKHKTFETALCSHTIATARAYGYTVTIKWGFVWKRIGRVFDAFVNKCEELEYQLRQHGLHLPIKLLRNSLAGKFGQKRERTTYYVTDTPTAAMCPAIDERTGEILPYLYWTESDQQAPHMMPHWAAWITAGARNYLVETAMRVGAGECVYADTDCLIMQRAAYERGVSDGVITVGPRYGEWKVVTEYATITVIGVKRYIGVDSAGIVESVYSGVPNDALDPQTAMLLKEELRAHVEYWKVPRAINRLLRTLDGRRGARLVSQALGP